MESDLQRGVGLDNPGAETNQTRGLVAAQGVAPTQVRVLTPPSTATGADAKSDRGHTLKGLLRSGAIIAAVGTTAVAGVSTAMAAADPPLSIALPAAG